MGWERGCSVSVFLAGAAANRMGQNGTGASGQGWKSGLELWRGGQYRGGRR
jgi:hypothetical protein